MVNSYEEFSPRDPEEEKYRDPEAEKDGAEPNSPQSSLNVSGTSPKSPSNVSSKTGEAFRKLQMLSE